MTPEAAIRQAFSGRNGYADPYQAKARDALCRILNAAKSAETQCDAIGEVIAFFLDDPPLSLLYDTPARQAEQLAKKLIALSNELRKGVAHLRSLTAYVNQFEPTQEGATDVSGREAGRVASEVPSQPASDECPF